MIAVNYSGSLSQGYRLYRKGTRFDYMIGFERGYVLFYSVGFIVPENCASICRIELVSISHWARDIVRATYPFIHNIGLYNEKEFLVWYFWLHLYITKPFECV